MSSPQFVLCPHCEGLLVCDPVSGRPPARCRHCGQMLEDLAESVPGDDTARAAVHAAQDAAQLAAPAVQAAPGPLPITLAASATADTTADTTVHTGITTDAAAHASAADAAIARVPNADANSDANSDAEHADAIAATADASASTSSSAAADSTMPARPAPRFATQTASPLRASGRSWALLAALALLLGAQLLLAQRAALATDARWRPLLLMVCGVLRCQLPAWHDPAAFEMLERNVAAVSGAPGTLAVSARFRQQARWAQAWPILQVQLLDADGRVLAVGRFAASDYLGHAPDAPLLAPGREVQARVHVREPPGGAVAFQFDFL